MHSTNLAKNTDKYSPIVELCHAELHFAAGRLDIGTVIKAQNVWRDIGLSQIAMCSCCVIHLVFFLQSFRLTMLSGNNGELTA